MIITEGCEVDFFVIAETSKGKLSDRAVHLGLLANGTVIFEVVLAESVRAVVIQEPTVHGSKEEPGTLELFTPVVGHDGKSQVCQVELWQRCLPSGLLCKAGDVLTIDVRHYRPDNLVFARSVSVEKYRGIGRQIGSVVSVVDDRFGFIKVFSQGSQAYFRVGEVSSASPLRKSYLKESEVVSGLTVSFDLTCDNGKMRAIRIREEASIPEERTDEARYLLLRAGVEGLVQREAKKEQAGRLQVFLSPTLTHADIDAPLHAPEVVVHDVAIAQAIAEMLHSPAIKSVLIEQLTPSQRRAWHLAINDLGKNSLVHETVDSPGVSASASDESGGSSRMKAVKIRKVGSLEEYLLEINSQKQPNEDSDRVIQPWDDDGLLSFSRQDSSDAYGPIAKDMQVVFDIVYDRKSGYRIAKNVILSDHPVEDADEDAEFSQYETLGFAIPVIDDAQFAGRKASVGVIEVVKSGKFGFIRRIASDEKLFWHCSSIAGYYPSSSSSSAIVDVNDLQEGRSVAFFVRKRGGLRCAVNIRLLEFGALKGLSILRPTLTAVSLGDGKLPFRFFFGFLLLIIS